MRKSAWGITVASAIAITGMSQQAEAECEFIVQETPIRAGIEKILKDADSLDNKLKEQVRTALKEFEEARGASSASEAAARRTRDSIKQIRWPDEHKASRASILELLDRSFLAQEVNFTNKSQGRLAVHLANPPASRLRLSFDANDGSHQELEWDPAVSSQLTKLVDLGHKVGTEWRLTVAIEPATYTQSQGTVLLTVRFNEATQSGSSFQLTGRYVALLAAAGSQTEPRGVSLNNWPAPQLTLTCLSDTPTRSMDHESFAPSAASQDTGGMRGFGVAPAIVTDTLSLLTEIAVERAKAGAMRVLKKRFVEPLCGADNSENGGVRLKDLVSGAPDGRAFPRTCDVLESLRLEDLLASGKALLTAVRDDLRYSFAPALVQVTMEQKLKLPAGVAQAVLAIANAAIDRGSFDGIAAQAAIEAFGRTAWQHAMQSARIYIKQLEPEYLISFNGILDINCNIEKVKNNNESIVYKDSDINNCINSINEFINKLENNKYPEAINNLDINSPISKLIGNACRARLAVAVTKRCSGGGCSTAAIIDHLSSPSKTFLPDQDLPWSLCWTRDGKYRTGTKTTEEIGQVILQGLELIAPVVDGRGPERAKAAIRLVAKLISVASGDAPPRNLEAFTEIAVALVDEDYATALGRLVGLLKECTERGSDKWTKLSHLRKLSSLLGAVASYTSVYRATKDEAPEAARKARKQALESIIDGATDRTGREEEWVTSIGSNVGFSFTASNEWLGLDDFEPGIRVPLGIATEYLPSSRGLVGVRLGAQVADLGQFVHRGTDDKVEEIEWADFVAPGVEAGMLLGKSVNLSLHVSYAPSVPKTMDTDGVWRVGLSLGYYVPFFDLN